MSENDLRETAIRTVANYMNQELFEITKNAEMLPFMRTQAEQIIDLCDSAIRKAHEHCKKNGIIK